ncbi:MAG: hypothetical protein IJ313_11095 [Clostridia bacterium]|nr:hypothetical protein [Clostridia bacterium]
MQNELSPLYRAGKSLSSMGKRARRPALQRQEGFAAGIMRIYDAHPRGWKKDQIHALFNRIVQGSPVFLGGFFIFLPEDVFFACIRRKFIL